MKIRQIIASGLLLSVLPFASEAAAVKKNLCVFDIVGTQGDVFNIMKDYKIAALEWGIDFNVTAFTDEKIAADDFKANKCDAVVITGIRNREFNSFSGTIDSLGSLPTNAHLKALLQTLTKPEAGKLMVNGNYEVVGILPLGIAYMYTRDRTINTVAKLSGKRIGVLEFDKASADMVNQVGAALVSTTMTNFAGKFNNGSVDAVGAPAVAFRALELYKGLNPENAANPPGGIVRFPVEHFTAQIVTHKDSFPADFGQKSREYVLSQVDNAFAISDRATTSIDSKYWIDLPEKDKKEYMEMFRLARMTIKKKGEYDGKMLSVMYKLRCKMDPSASECTAQDHE
ncbi:MAG TPA: putative solute-binding protein [Pseudomonadales bacterium]|nr:putative solute-binding protein [Pseudomonadales bacterium]